MDFSSREALATSMLAQAVYTDFPTSALGAGDAARTALVSALAADDAVDTALADEIGRRYALLRVYDGGWTGFYGAVFQDRATHQLYLAIRGTEATSPLDLWNDATVALGATQSLFNQGESLRRFVADIRAEQAAGTLPAGALTLTGHSLGGHLVQRAAFEHAGLAAAAYTFNSAGVGGFLGLLGGGGYLLSSENQFVQNFIAEPGVEIVSSWLSGMRPGREYATFIEDQAGSSAAPLPTEIGGITNHAMAPLTDALGVYRVLDLLAHGQQSFESLTALLGATTRHSLDTLESTLGVIAGIFGVSTDSPHLVARARLHELSYRLIDTLEGAAGVGAGIVNLLGESPAALAAAAGADTPRGLAVRFALMHGLPFALTGVDYSTTVDADGRYDLTRYSPEYLRARAEYAHLLFAANERDSAELPDALLAANQRFVDLATDTTLASADALMGGGTFFGRDRGDSAGTAHDRLVGTAFDDRLFGAAGDDRLEAGSGDDLLDGGDGADTLVGGVGRDTLQGGAGVDTYVIDAAARHALIRGDDGQGDATGRDRILVMHETEVEVLGATPLELVASGGGSYADAAGNRYLPADGGLRVQLAGGAVLDIEGFADGDFGLALGAADPLAPPPGAALYTVQPLAPQPRGPATGSYETTGWQSPGAFYATDAAEDVHAIAPLVTDAAAQTPYLSVTAGFGDSMLVGDDGFNWLVDDQRMGAGALLGAYGLGDEVGDDLLLGGGGDDWLVSQGGSDRVFGGAGDDVLIDSHATWDLALSQQRGTPTRWGYDSVGWVAGPGHASDDRMQGDDGDDFLIAHGGRQSMEGGAGRDELYAGAGDDLLVGGDGDDVLGADIRAADALLRVTGLTPSGYRLMAFDGDRLDHDLEHAGRDVLDGGGGNDVLFGGGGEDTLDGGAGDDALFGDFTTPSGVTAAWAQDLRAGIRGLATLPAELQGADRIAGGAGRDTIDAGGGDDIVDGGDDADTILGGAGDDRLRGGGGDDVLRGDPVSGADGRDELDGEDGDDLLYGHGGADVLRGGAGSDQLSGGAGDDVLDGGVSAGALDTLAGGEGDDRYRLAPGGSVQIDDAAGRNRIEYALPAAVAPLTVRRGAGVVQLDFGGSDTIVMTPASFAALDAVVYADGRTLERDAIEHAFAPAAIADGRLVLGAGVASDEVVLRRYNDDLLLEYCGSVTGWVDTTGFDARGIAHRFAAGDAFGGDAGARVLVLTNWFRAPSASYLRTLVAAGEPEQDLAARALVGPRTLTVAPGGAALVGATAAEELLGSGGDDVLQGAAGDDVLRGGRGADLLDGGEGDDEYVYAAGDGVDVLIDASGDDDRVRLGADIEPGMLRVSETLVGLEVTVGDGGDRLVLANWARGADRSVDALVFADGTRLDRAALDALNTGNHAPRLAGALPEPVVRAGQAFTVAPPGGLFRDADAGDTLSWSIRGADGTAPPAWLAIDAGSGVITGNAPATAAGDHAFVVVVRDRGGLVNEAPLALRVTRAVVLMGTAGNDTLRASGTQPHEIFGLDGVDVLAGAGGADRLDGGEGADQLSGGAGVDQLLGGPGDDVYTLADTVDAIIELPDEGIDTVKSAYTATLPVAVENLTLTGTAALSGAGNELDNLLIGNAANNTLTGGAGDDRLDGGSAGADTLVGGAGDDVYIVNSTTDRVLESAAEGVDGVRSTVSWTLGANVENLELIGTAAINAIGNGLDNVLIGSTRQNLLDGGVGVDSMAGGGGDDIYVVDDSRDVVSERPGQGNDLVRASASYVLSDEVEQLTLTGVAAIDGTGNGLDNIITGNVAANRLAGGAGNDTYSVDHAGDAVVERAGEGLDLVRSSVSFALSAEVENLQLTGTTAINATGNARDNVLTGNSASNVLTGGAGDDTYVVDRATDRVIEQAGEGIDTIRSTATLALPANVENLTLEGSATINGTGNDLDNRLTGNLANNLLTGGAGNDRMNGGSGADRMFGGTGDDLYLVNSQTDETIEYAGEGVDTVESITDYTLANAQVENLTLSVGATRGTGNDRGNVITGNGAGNRLEGMAGDDRLVGGRGDDTLLGGVGADHYIYASGDGNDVVIEAATDGAMDHLVFTDLTLPELRFERDGDDLLVANDRVAGEMLRVTGWFQGVQNPIEWIETADGLATSAGAVSGLLAGQDRTADAVEGRLQVGVAAAPALALASRVDSAVLCSMARARPAGPGEDAIVLDALHERLVHMWAGFADWRAVGAEPRLERDRTALASAWLGFAVAPRSLAA